MSQKEIENTLFLGNGFSRSIFRGIPSWGTLYEGVDSGIQNYPFLYEAFRQTEENKKRSEETIKEELVKKIKSTVSEKNIREDIHELEKLGEYLSQNHIYNIITTNYDNGVELILCRSCGYVEEKTKGSVSERIYSIRTFKVFFNEKTGHRVKLWKIHGDINRTKSITLGFDQYCGSLWKLNDYVKGTYKASRGESSIECRVPMEEKCRKQKFDGISWAELFFRTNLYIVGFGMALSEIDIWWLLNKRARLKLEVPEIENRITYLYNPEYEDKTEKQEINALLQSFGVSIVPLRPNGEYLDGLFEVIQMQGSEAFLKNDLNREIDSLIRL